MTENNHLQGRSERFYQHMGQINVAKGLTLMLYNIPDEIQCL